MLVAWIKYKINKTSQITRFPPFLGIVKAAISFKRDIRRRGKNKGENLSREQKMIKFSIASYALNIFLKSGNTFS